MSASSSCLCFVRQWWRPAICVGIAASVMNVGVILPLLTKTQPDLVGLAAVIGAASPFAMIREWGKHKGTAE